MALRSFSQILYLVVLICFVGQIRCGPSIYITRPFVDSTIFSTLLMLLYLLSFIPRTITYPMVSNASSPKAFHALAYFISVSLIVFPDRTLLFKDFPHTILKRRYKELPCI